MAAAAAARAAELASADDVLDPDALEGGAAGRTTEKPDCLLEGGRSDG